MVSLLAGEIDFAQGSPPPLLQVQEQLCQFQSLRVPVAVVSDNYTFLRKSASSFLIMVYNYSKYCNLTYLSERVSVTLFIYQWF